MILLGFGDFLCRSNKGDNIDDWLDQFEMFSIYEVLPEILALWGTNLITDIDSKKN